MQIAAAPTSCASRIRLFLNPLRTPVSVAIKTVAENSTVGTQRTRKSTSCSMSHFCATTIKSIMSTPKIAAAKRESATGTSLNFLNAIVRSRRTDSTTNSSICQLAKMPFIKL